MERNAPAKGLPARQAPAAPGPPPPPAATRAEAAPAAPLPEPSCGHRRPRYTVPTQAGGVGGDGGALQVSGYGGSCRRNEYHRFCPLGIIAVALHLGFIRDRHGNHGEVEGDTHLCAAASHGGGLPFAGRKFRAYENVINVQK